LNLELDHVFVFVERGGRESARRLAALGLLPTYSREHMGQGTANLCFAFDNAYLELVWVDEPEVLARATFTRTGLFERSMWRRLGTSPFGICVRSARPLAFPCWLWRPPYLPPGLFLEVATSSLDPALPFLFRFPGAHRPDTWPPGLVGNRQHQAGLAEITGLKLQALPHAEHLEGLELDPAMDQQRCELTLSRTDGGPDRRLLLPELTWLA